MEGLGFFRVELLVIRASSTLLSKSLDDLRLDYSMGIVHHGVIPLSINLYDLVRMEIMSAEPEIHEVVKRLMELGKLKDVPASLHRPMSGSGDLITAHPYLDFVEMLDNLTQGYSVFDRGVNYSFITDQYGAISR